MFGRSLLSGLFRSDPVDRIDPVGVGRALGCIGHDLAVAGNVLRLAGDLGRAGGGRLAAFDLRRALVHVLRVLLGRRRFEVDPDHGREQREGNAHAAGDLLVLGVHVLVEEDQREQRQERDHGDDRAELVLDEETEAVGAARRIVAIGGLPHQTAADREHRDHHQQPDQQRQVALIELVLLEHHDPGDLGADRHHPGQRCVNAQAFRCALLALRCSPGLGDVYWCNRFVVGHVRTLPLNRVLHDMRRPVKSASRPRRARAPQGMHLPCRSARCRTTRCAPRAGWGAGQ